MNTILILLVNPTDTTRTKTKNPQASISTWTVSTQRPIKTAVEKPEQTWMGGSNEFTQPYLYH